MNSILLEPLSKPTMNDVSRVLSWIDDHGEEIIDLLQRLVRVPSVNPWFLEEPGQRYEEQVQDLIAEELRIFGATIDRWQPDPQTLSKYQGKPGYYPDHKFEGRPNQAGVIKGVGNGKSLLLTGHVDVVKAGSDWSVHPFSAVRKDGRIIGRGVVDMKGGIAAMISAVKAIHSVGFKNAGDICIGTVVDEEAGGMGTLAFVDRGYRADGCILTEPTDLTIAPLCRGILWGKLRIKGRSGHIELPQEDWRNGGAVDAIRLCRFFLEQLDNLNTDWAVRKTHPLLPMPCQVYVAQLKAGEYPTTFAGEAEMVFNAQYLPAERDNNFLGGKVKREIEDFIISASQKNEWLIQNPPKVEWLIDADCAETPENHPFVETCKASLLQVTDNAVIQGIGSHTDMGWFVNVGIPTINFGPGKPSVAHQSDESLKEEDLITATKVLAVIVMNWCGISKSSQSEIGAIL
ncbi:MAG: acetylornithine deacetylase [Bellilinea sp.]|nr:MAG: acetylornithine deacetylase [Bellilinea sp.]